MFLSPEELVGTPQALESEVSDVEKKRLVISHLATQPLVTEDHAARFVQSLGPSTFLHLYLAVSAAVKIKEVVTIFRAAEITAN